MKNSKVKSIQANGNFKELYKFEVELDNGDIGTLYRKSNDSKLTNGQDISYTINDKGTLKIVTDYQKNQSQSSPKQNVYKNDSIARAVAFKGALEFMDIINHTKCTEQEVIEKSKYFYDNWLCDNYTDKIDMIKKSFDAEVKDNDLPF